MYAKPCGSASLAALGGKRGNDFTIGTVHDDAATASQTATVNSTMAKLIHNGDKTHHHDQVIIPVSFRPMKRMVSRPAKPMPPLLAFFDSLTIDPPVSVRQPCAKLRRGLGVAK